MNVVVVVVVDGALVEEPIFEECGGGFCFGDSVEYVFCGPT